jgi:Pyruvate/2-oxoacid:ferredoxin oxidoreductase gamma subunit
MDLCGTVAAAGAPWVYRATAFDKDLADIVAQAIQQPGFAMLDVWELCSAYYSPRNKLNKANLFALLDSYGFQRGLLADKPRAEYSAHYREVYEKGKRKTEHHPLIERRFSHTLARQTGIVIAGSAGQKVRSTATLFAQSSMYSGLEATQKDDYPITVMTGHSVSEVILSPERIDYTAIDVPDYIVVITEDGLKRVRSRIERLPEGSTVIAEESLDLPHTKALVIRLPIIQTSHELGKLTAAIIAVASLIQYSAMFPVQAFAAAVSTFQKASIAETNIEALEVGAALVAGKGLGST